LVAGRAVACQSGLRRQGVHRLSAADARHKFHGQRDCAGLGDGVERLAVLMRVQQRRNQRALLQGADIGDLRRPHLEQDVGILQRSSGGFGDSGAGRLILGVRN
jgi:hypothetical protein